MRPRRWWERADTEFALSGARLLSSFFTSTSPPNVQEATGSRLEAIAAITASNKKL